MTEGVRPVTAATQWVIWASMTVATVAYTVIAFLVRPGEAPGVSLPDVQRPLELMLAAAAGGALVMGFFLPRMLGAQAGRDLAERRDAGEPELRLAAQVPLIVQWALFESVAIYGFVMVFAGAPASRAVPFSALALALLAIHPPTRARIDTLLGR